MSAANTESAYKEAAHLFESIIEYKDAASLAKECYKKAEIAREEAEIARKDEILLKANHKMNSDFVYECETAIALLESIPGWKDADEKLAACKEKTKELKEKEKLARIEAEKRSKRVEKIALITILSVCVIIAFILILTKVIIPNSKYNNALALMDAGKYSDAILAFEALEGYKDSVTKITECNTAILDGKYNDAIALMDAGNIVEAYDALIALDGYKDSTDRANSIYAKYQLKTAKVGDYISFGSYEQDNNTSNGKEDIEWRVLSFTGNKILVISRYALEFKPYNTSLVDVTWETCSLRKWLNNDFINTAFTADEKSMISTVTSSDVKNSEYDTNPGNITQDQVFLLSRSEATRLLRTPVAREFSSTAYAYANRGNYGWFGLSKVWWLRSPGSLQNQAAAVLSDGFVTKLGYDVDDDLGVCPAMWIDLNS